MANVEAAERLNDPRKVDYPLLGPQYCAVLAPLDPSDTSRNWLIAAS
jgi:hypothetical protein